ncbi:MAG: carboxypeptidase-like regulatory domain-containing protein [Nonlabens sp.]
MFKIKYIILCLLLGAQLCVAQTDRFQIKGLIVNSLEIPQGGITVFNQNSQDGTVTNEEGKFSIAVASGDRLLVQAIQYESFTMVVTGNTLKQREIHITLREGINRLDEVILNDNLMIVDVVDSQKIDLGLDQIGNREFNIPAIDRVENTFSDMERQPDHYRLRNLAQEQSQLRFAMFDFLGLFLGLLNAIIPPNLKIDYRQKAVEEQFNISLIKNNYNPEELVQFLDIERKELSRFLYFASDHGLNREMLATKDELEIMQFLANQAKLYKSKKQ